MKNLKFLVLLIIFVFGLSFSSFVLAQEATPPVQPTEEPIYTPRLLPDSPFYFFKGVKEKIELAFAFTPEKKAEKLAEMATRRVAEAKAMIKKGKPEWVEKLMKRYQSHLEEATKKIEEAKQKGRDVEQVIGIITQATSQHQGVLTDVYQKVPPPAQKAIEQAIEVSRKGQERALEAVSGKKKEELRRHLEEKIKEKKPIIKEILQKWDEEETEKEKRRPGKEKEGEKGKDLIKPLRLEFEVKPKRPQLK